jgi:hypothetical protein
MVDEAAIVISDDERELEALNGTTGAEHNGDEVSEAVEMPLAMEEDVKEEEQVAPPVETGPMPKRVL